MGKEIFINDSVGTVEFPDTMSDDEIANTIKTKILGQTEQTGDTPKSESPVTVSTPEQPQTISAHSQNQPLQHVKSDWLEPSQFTKEPKATPTVQDQLNKSVSSHTQNKAITDANLNMLADEYEKIQPGLGEVVRTGGAPSQVTKTLDGKIQLVYGVDSRNNQIFNMPEVEVMADRLPENPTLDNIIPSVNKVSERINNNVELKKYDETVKLFNEKHPDFESQMKKFNEFSKSYDSKLSELEKEITRRQKAGEDTNDVVLRHNALVNELKANMQIKFPNIEQAIADNNSLVESAKNNPALKDGFTDIADYQKLIKEYGKSKDSVPPELAKKIKEARKQREQSNAWDIINSQTSVRENDPEFEKRRLAVMESSNFHTRTLKDVGIGMAGMIEGGAGVGQWIGIEGSKSFGDKVQAWSQAMAPNNPTLYDEMFQNLGSQVIFLPMGYGVGTLSSLMFGFSPKIAVAFGAGVSSVVEAAIEAGGSYRDVMLNGGTKEQADKAATLTFGLNVPLIYFTDKFILGGIKGDVALQHAMSSTVTNAFQEGAQTGITNYATGKPLLQDTFKSAVFGGIIGGGMSAALPAMEGVEFAEPRKQQVTQEQIDNFVIQRGEYLASKMEASAKVGDKTSEKKYADLLNEWKNAKQEDILKNYNLEVVLPRTQGLSEIEQQVDLLFGDEQSPIDITKKMGINEIGIPFNREVSQQKKKEPIFVPTTISERITDPAELRTEAISLLQQHELTHDEAVKVVVNLSNKEVEDFVNARPLGMEAASRLMGTLPSVQDKKAKKFAEEESLRTEAEGMGVVFKEKIGRGDKTVDSYDDPYTGSGFTVNKSETLGEAILRSRKSYDAGAPLRSQIDKFAKRIIAGEKIITAKDVAFYQENKKAIDKRVANPEKMVAPAPVTPVEAVAPAPIVPEVLPVIEEPIPVEQPKVEKPKVEKVKPVKAEPKPINLDKKKGKRGGRPLKYAQIDENTSPIIASGFRIQPAFELRDNKVQITEEFRGLEDFLDYSNKPSKEQLISASKKKVEGNIDTIADEYYSERGEQGDGETFREALRKEKDTFDKQGGYWSKDDIDEVVKMLDRAMIDGNQDLYVSTVSRLSPKVREIVFKKLDEIFKEQRNESEIVKSDAEIEDFGNQINSAAEAEEIERILQEFDNERPEGISDEQIINAEGQSADEIAGQNESIQIIGAKVETLEAEGEVVKSEEKRNDIINEINENVSEIAEELDGFKQKKRTYKLATEGSPSHPFIQELYNHIFYTKKAIENKLSQKDIAEEISFWASQRISGQRSEQKQIRQELMKALTGVEDVTRRESGLTDVVKLLQQYFEKVQPDQDVLDKLEAKKKDVAEQKSKAIGHDQIFIDTFNALKDEAEKKDLSNPLTAEPIILGQEVGKKEVTMKYVPAEDTYTVTYKQIDNHVTHIKHYNTLQQVLKDYRNEVNKYYEDPNKVRSEEEKQKVIKEAEANLDDILGEEPPPEAGKKPGEFDDDVLLQEGEVVKPSYDNEIRYQKVKFYFNQMFRELGKNEQQFKDRIKTKYGNKLDNFVKRFFDENEIQERPTVQYVNAGKLPIPPEYVTASQYNNAMDDHQMFGLNSMIHNEKNGNKAFLLADAPGFGKTRQELAFADYMYKKTGRPALLVTQSKQIIKNSFNRQALAMGLTVQAQDELFEDGKKKPDAPSLNKNHIQVVTYNDITNIYEIKTEKQLKSYAKKGYIFYNSQNKKISIEDATKIVNEKGTVLARKFDREQQYSAVIFDESQNLKNADAKRSASADQVKADHHVYATATPMDNPHNAEYFLSKITGIPANEIRRSMGYKVIFGEDQWKNPTRKIEYEQGKSYSTVQTALLRMRDSAIENGAMVRREYPFYGMVQPMYLALDQFQLAEQESIDSGYGPHPNSRKAAISEMSRWTEPLKLNRVFDSAMQDLKEGKQVIIVAEGVNDTELKKLGTTVRGFITSIGEKFTDAGVPFAMLYGGGDVSGEIDAFQSGKVKVALMTPQTGGAGVDLDDANNIAPRKMYVVTTNYAGDVFEQILGRVSRRNTKSPADIRLVQFTNATTDRNRQNIIQRKLATLHSIQSGIDPDKAVMDENEEKINGVIRTSGSDQLSQEGEARTPIPMDEAVPKPTTKREQVVQAVYAQLPEQQAKAAMFVLDAGAYSAVQNGKAKSIADYYENTLSQVTRMNYDPNMVFGNALQQAFDRGLFAVHNTDAEMIPTFLNEGGIPAPSIAVLTSPENFREFSTEVQLVFERKTVDPKANKENRLFGGDIFSPRAGEYRGSLSKVVEQVKKEFEARPRGAEFGDESRTAIPLRAFVAQEFTDLEQAKNASNRLIKAGTNDGLARLSRQSKSELGFAEAVNDILFKEPIGEVATQDKEAKEFAIQLVEKQAFGIDQIREILGITKTDKATNDKLFRVQQAMFELFQNTAPDYFEAKPLRVVGVEEIQGVIVTPRMFEEVKKMVKGTILEGKVYKGDGNHGRLEAIRDLMKRNPQIMFQEDLSKELEEQYIREQEAKGNLNIREQIKEQKYQKELGIRKAELAQKRQAKENQFNSLVRQESQFKRDIEFARKKNDQEGVQKGLSALKSVQQQMNRLYKELGKSTDDMFDDSPTLFQIPGSRKTVQGATDFADFARTGKVALYIFENANFSTVVHEFMHIWRRTGVFNEEQIQTLNNWVGSQDWSNWTKSQEEKLARGFERYLYNGEAPNQNLRRIFQKMKKWMQEIYVMIQKGDPLDIELPVEVKRVFDAIFDENAKTTDIFNAIKQHNESIEQSRQMMKDSMAKESQLYRMYATEEMLPILRKKEELMKKLETASPYEANDILEELTPLRLRIDEMSDFLKSVSSLASKYKAHDRKGNMSNWFISRFALMTKLLGKAGGELVQRAFAGDLLSAKLMDIARPHQHEIDQIYEKYSSKPNADENIFARTKDRLSLWYNGKPVTSKQIDISRAVINAIEEKRNASWQIGDKAPSEITIKNSDGTVNEEMTNDAKKVFEETKALLDKIRDILTSQGFKTREAYFTSVQAFDIMDQQMDIDIMRMRVEDENGKTVFSPRKDTQIKLQKNVTAESNRLKPRNDVVINRDTYLPGVLSSYMRSISRKLSYGQMVDYIKNDLSGDISTQLKKEKGVETLLDIARDYALNVMHPEVAHGHWYNALMYMRGNMFKAFLSYNVKATMDNMLQRNLTLLYVSKAADVLESKLWELSKQTHQGISGNLALALEYSRNAMQNYMELTPANETGMSKFRRGFEKYDPFKGQEISNWKRSEALGVIDSAMKNKRYPELLKKHKGDELSAINEVLEDDIAFGKAVSYASYISVESQVGITPSTRPMIFDNPISRVTWLMLRSFKFRQVELLARSFKTLFMENGLREEALRTIFAQGITPDAEPAEALQYFVKYEKALSQLIKQMKREGNPERDGVTLTAIEKYQEHIQKQVSDLDIIVQELQPVNDKARITKVWAKYYALLAVNSYSHKLLWYFIRGAIFGWLFYNPDDEKEKSIEGAFAEAHTRVMLDLSPIPAYGMNPSNLTLTPLFPNIELFPYGKFNERELTKGLVRYGVNAFIPYAGVANRVVDNGISSSVTDFIVPRKRGGNLTPQEKMEEQINRQRKALEKRSK